MRTNTLLRATLTLLLAACGGGGQTTMRLDIPATDALTGDAIDGQTPLGSVQPFVGDTPTNLGIRAFYSFDLSGLPAGAAVTQAVFTTAQVGAPFGTPYADLGGAIVVTHVDLGGTLDTGDFDSPALTPSPGAISDDPAAGVRSLDVTAQVVADLGAGRTTSEYRLAFAADTEGGNDEDTVQFEDALGAGGTVPILSVLYVVP